MRERGRGEGGRGGDEGDNEDDMKNELKGYPFQGRVS